jgi:hypothetical protein
MTTPKARRSSVEKSEGWSPASDIASRADARASGTVRATWRRSFCFSSASQSKPLASAAIRTGDFETSKPSMRRTPLSPRTSARQKASRPTPTGVTQPSPVMTTRRGCLKRLGIK